ncbi:MAG: hypothetical protein JO295_10770 [Verrucomicrobia bacterium]|nr:hypothetical protein [Verrucomicrobiota bacterium]
MTACLALRAICVRRLHFSAAFGIGHFPFFFMDDLSALDTDELKARVGHLRRYL